MLEHVFMLYLRPFMLLVMVFGFVLIHRKQPSFFTVGLIVGSTMHLCSSMLSIIFSPSGRVGSDGRFIVDSIPPDWVTPVSMTLGWLGAIFLAICLIGFAHRLPALTETT